MSRLSDRGPRVLWSGPWLVFPLGRLALGALLPVIPVALFLAWMAGADAWQDLIVFPATVFSKVFSEPYPSLLPRLDLFADWLADPSDLGQAHAAFSHLGAWIICNAPQIVFLVGLVVVVRHWQRMRAATRSAVVLFLCLMPPYWLAAHVQQNTHPYTMAVFGLLLAGMAHARLGLAEHRRRWRRRTLTLAVSVYAIGLLISAGLDLGRVILDWPKSEILNLPMAKAIRVPSRDLEVYRPIVALLEKEVPPGEAIYVGVQRHDAIVITNMRFYYLVRRPGCTPYRELHPGLADHEEVQEEIIASINNHGVRYVVLWRFGAPHETVKRRRMAALPGLGATLLDEFIASAFEPVAEFGEYVVLRRRQDSSASHP